MTPRVATNTLSESVERARLELKHRTGELDQYERHRRTLLLSGDPSRNLTVGERAATSPEFLKLAVTASKTSDNTQLALAEDVTLAQLDNGAEVKALITGLSDPSAGAFITNQSVDYIPQPRRRLRILDLVRVSSTSVDAVEYARQTTFTNSAAEVLEATNLTTGSKPESAIAFEKRTENVKNYATWVPATRRGLSDVDEMKI
jgi:HK97 family phage major capsid protein